MKPKTISLIAYTDPGHGWVKISLDKLFDLGIAHKISSFSYARGNFAYLEEDCDASILVAALEENGYDWKITTKNTNKSSKIRSYWPYQAQ